MRVSPYLSAVRSDNKMGSLVEILGINDLIVVTYTHRGSAHCEPILNTVHTDQLFIW